MEEKSQIQNPEIGKKMSRKEAIRKTGYIALSAVTMMLLLSKPENALAQSSPASLPTTPWP